MWKNKRNLYLALFLLTVAAGVYYPISKLLRFEFPLTPPAVYRFESRLVDPYDPFRGRYVTLSTPSQIVRFEEEREFPQGVAYASLRRKKDGLTEVVDLSAKPLRGEDVLRVHVSLWNKSWAKEEGIYEYHVFFPFQRFYMNEKLAPEAERAVAGSMRARVKVEIVAKIYADGNYAISDLELNGIPIAEYVKEMIEEERMAREAVDSDEADVAKLEADADSAE